jgi:hypothetical protein
MFFSKKLKYIVLLLIFQTIFSFSADTETTGPVVKIEYLNDVSGNLSIINEDGTEELFSYDISVGTKIPIGWTVLTGNGDSVELIMEPGGSIIRISENTNFKVMALQGIDESESSDFELIFGKFRTIAAKLTGEEIYNFYGQTSTCGVRGTDFGMQIITDEVYGIKEETFVFEGEVQMTHRVTGQSISLAANQYANAADFKIIDMSPAMRSSLQEQLTVEEPVPPETPPVEPVPPETVPEPVIEPPVPEPEETVFQTPIIPESEINLALIENTIGSGGLFINNSPLPDSGNKSGSGSKFISNLFSFEVGTIVLDEQVYGKAVYTPSFVFGKFELSLYLPIIYMNNIMDPGDWYRPNGNNEWSFGTDQDSREDTVKDVISDFVLKLRYIKFGEQRDKFHFQAGNLSSITLGHGFIMKDYANDIDFPAIRRIGFNLGVNTPVFGFESMASDLTSFEIIGGRFYIKPGLPIGVGISVLADINPCRNLPSDLGITKEDLGDPIIFAYGLDIDVPIVDKEDMRLVYFFDVASLIPYFRENSTFFPNVEKGFKFSSFINTDPDFSLRNVGAGTGIIAETGPFDWRAEYRMYNGIFEPGLFNNMYGRGITNLGYKMSNYINDPSAEEWDKFFMSLYGELKYTREDIFYIEGAYNFPVSIGNIDGFQIEEKDYLHFEAGMLPTATPINLGTSLTYDRNYLIQWIINQETKNGEELSFFDAFSFFKYSILYGPTDNVDVMFVFTTTADRNSDGTINYKSDGTAEMVTTFTLETHMHF